MTDRPDFSHRWNRRSLLRHLGRGALGAGAALAASRAQAQDQMLQLLMEQTRRSDFGQTYDSGIRSVRMPKSSLPTLSPQTVQTTEAAIPRYEQLAAQGGWQTVPRERADAARQSQQGRDRLAAAVDRGRRSRHQRRCLRCVRFLRRGGGKALPGAPRPDRRRHRARGNARGDECSGRACGSRSSRPIWFV